MARPHTKASRKRNFKKRFLTKGQAKRLLQLDNKEFKRVLILKGIYPRQPSNFRSSEGKDKVYYLTRDIKYLVADPILQTLRDYATHEKKCRTLEAEAHPDEAERFDKTHRPHYTLDHTIRERYPRFPDALRDLGDALSSIFLYAILPPTIASETTIEGHAYPTTGMHQQCQALAERWSNYVATQHALEKGFISIKGFYYQARVQGRPVVWRVPHDFAAAAPKTVEHRVLLSFLEFYLSFVRFVLYKLEKDAAGEAKEAQECTPESVPFPKEAEGESEKEAVSRRVFSSLVFYLSREAVPAQVGFVIRCLGGRVVPFSDFSDITHVVVDRPSLPPGEEKREGVEYLQPQYVFDCLNTRMVLPVAGYEMGERCPPHISPFTVSLRKEGEVESVSDETKVTHRAVFHGDVPQRAQELRKLVDPSYVAGVESGSVAQEDEKDVSETNGLKATQRGKKKTGVEKSSVVDSKGESSESMNDESSSEEDLIREAPFRSATSEALVEKQRRLGLDNKPENEKKLGSHTSSDPFAKEEGKKSTALSRKIDSRKGAASLLSKKVRGIYEAASFSKRQVEEKAEALGETRASLKKGRKRVHSKGYIV